MGLSGWRDIAIVLLAVEGIVVAWVFGFILYYSIKGVLWLKRKTPTVTRPVQYYMSRAADVTRQAGDAAATPFIWLGSNAAQVRVAWSGLKRRGKDV
jgi:hypothetical protein